MYLNCSALQPISRHSGKIKLNQNLSCIMSKSISKLFLMYRPIFTLGLLHWWQYKMTWIWAHRSCQILFPGRVNSTLWKSCDPFWNFIFGENWHVNVNHVPDLSTQYYELSAFARKVYKHGKMQCFSWRILLEKVTIVSYQLDKSLLIMIWYPLTVMCWPCFSLCVRLVKIACSWAQNDVIRNLIPLCTKCISLYTIYDMY